MDWKATGLIDTATLQLEQGRDRHSPLGEALTFEPTLAKLEKDAGTAHQADFACNALGEAVLAGLLDGTYEIELSGNTPGEGDRPSLLMRFTPR